MIIIMSVTYLYGQALEMDVTKIKTWFKVLGLWKFYVFLVLFLWFCTINKRNPGNSLAVQWLRLSASIAGAQFDPWLGR